MIPSDVASRLQVSADATLRPVAPAQEISDKLSGLVAGQKVMAEIQALLPNGTYRAMINQRNVTLALPFSAKAGDALELLVTESDGKLALAVTTRPDGEAGKAGVTTTAATLSRTGQLIASLFSGASEAKGGSNAVTLNLNQPIASSPPSSAQDILPLLKQAITQSGMFYESHQAEWVEGRFTKAALLQEPQGKLSSPAAFDAPAKAVGNEQAAAAILKAPLATAEAGLVRHAHETVQTTSGQMIAPQTQALVQQQLQALATHNFSWQGQVWPGQEMQWEIDEDAAHRGQESEDSNSKWSTRLRLELPSLGEIDALIRLEGQQITLSMSAGSSETRERMRAASLALRSQLDEAGLTLASMGIEAIAEKMSDGQTGQ